jgi:hypothetical protein
MDFETLTRDMALPDKAKVEEILRATRAMQAALQAATKDLTSQMAAIELLMVAFAMRGDDDVMAREIIHAMHKHALTIVLAPDRKDAKARSRKG